jgi:hypothetical protein
MLLKGSKWRVHSRVLLLAAASTNLVDAVG